ncbi:MAG: carboxypeptidase-like regulatory domain-containing protein, partial [Bacteroidales bacterium]|nr:carboxypeptidase-like regulatory domain-containing protein [Bacteroidales bacterium]
MNKLYTVLFLLLFAAPIAGLNQLYAQDATIRGFIYESETGEPVIFTNAYLYKTTYGASTDVNGYYVINKIPPGSYTLMVTSMGFDTLREQITLKAGDIINKNLFVNESSITLRTVHVSAERQAASTETRTSIVKVTP